MASKLKRYPETGISVLIVGSETGGLMSALECWRKGHSVQLLERMRDRFIQVSCTNGQLSRAKNTLVSLSDFRMLMLIVSGDNLTIQPSALSILRHWLELCKEIEEEQYDRWMAYYKHIREYIYGPNSPSFNDPENTIGRKGLHVAFMQSRIKFYKSLIRQAERLGLCIEYNKRVVSYYEDQDVGIGGVVLESGERREADAVIAADGIKTHSGKVISGEEIQPKESGMVIYRSAYPTEHALSEPLVKG